MKIAAIIAEYNPFHNGHAYHIQETKKITGADFCLVLMSGDFVQRGAPAFCNKYLRTQMALQEGADAVFELPSLYSVSSAEYFAGGSISILNNLNAVDFLSFGSESGNITDLKSCTSDLLKITDTDYKQILSFLNEGYSFPSARQEVLSNNSHNSFSSRKWYSLLSSPNNILALEYCKLLTTTHSNIKPITVKRLDSAYHDDNLSDADSPLSSASSIRSCIQAGTSVSNHVPDSVYQIMIENQLLTVFLCSNDFSSLLHYKLLSEQQAGFSKYLDCNDDLSDRICNYIHKFENFDSFCKLIKSKNITYSRICRIMIHILLNITTPEFYSKDVSKRLFDTPYVRLLGFRKDSSEMLAKLKKSTSIPIISKPANASNLLSESSYQMFLQDLYCSDLYQSVYRQKNFSTNSKISNGWKNNYNKADIQYSPIVIE